MGGLTMSVPTRSPTLICCLAGAVLLTLVGMNTGCDEEEAPAVTRAERRAEELSRQLQAEQRQHTRDLATARTQADQAIADVHAAHTIIIGAGIAVVILVLLLARERRARRVLERLLRMLLHRLRARTVFRE
jgi:hypothetical protein